MTVESHYSKKIDKFLDLHIKILSRVLIQKNWKSIETEFEDDFERFDYLNTAQILNALAFDKSGNLHAAYPISPRENQFQVKVEGVGSGYAMCAIDSLGVAYTFGKKTQIISRDPTTGNEIQINIDPENENYKNYSDIVITTPKGVFRPVEENVLDQAKDICPYVGFVRNIGLISEEDRDNYSLLTFDEALRYGKLAFDRESMKNQILEFLNTISLLVNTKSLLMDDFVRLYAEKSTNPALTSLSFEEVKQLIIGQLKRLRVIIEVERSGEIYIELTEIALNFFKVFN
ncbi:MAG: organomercurial lyase [Promethearchaeota archaeon]|jgi:hypothetical protein